MRKKALAATFVFILSVLVGAGLQVSHIATANFLPEMPPSGIQITSGGTVEGTDLIQQSGNIYTLTGNIKGTIVVLRDGIVLDGAGYSVEGSGSGVGVFLQGRNDVVIKNMRISNFDFGIKFTWQYYGSLGTVSGKTLSGNTVTNNTYGIYINDFSSGNKLSGNTLTNNVYGICLVSCSNNVLRDNRITGNDFNFFVSGGTLSTSPNDVDQSNTVNGAPIIYWVNEQGKTVPEDAGFVALVNCTDMTVRNLNLVHAGQGILLAGVTNSKITDNSISRSAHGIWLIESQDNQIKQNKIEGTDYEACYFSSSSGNSITENTFVGNGLKGRTAEEVTGFLGRCALRFYDSSNNQIVGNKIIGNGEGIDFSDSNGNTVSSNSLENTLGKAVYMYGSDNNEITKNTITGNECGIKIWESNNIKVRSNLISNNSLGILLDGAQQNSIIQNEISNNTGFGIQLKSVTTRFGASKNNVIHHNNFINNQPDGLDVSIPAMMGEHVPSTLETEWLPGLGNAWDDGREGNYWSDYLTRYPNASEIDHTRTGDTPYFINENNIDNHPLMSPSVIPVDLSSPSLQPTTSGEPTVKAPTENQTETEPCTSLPFITASVAVFFLVIVMLLIYLKKHNSVAAFPTSQTRKMSRMDVTTISISR